MGECPQAWCRISTQQHRAARWTAVMTQRARFNKLFLPHFRHAVKCVCVVYQTDALAWKCICELRFILCEISEVCVYPLR